MRLLELRVLIISEHYFPIVGGSPTYVHNLCKNLSNLGCEVYLVTIPDDRNPVMEWCKEDGFYIYRLKIPRILRKERYFPIFINRELDYLVKSIKPDVIHIGHGFFIPLITRFTNIRNYPVVWTVHNVPPKEHKFDFLTQIPILNNILKQIYFKIGDIYSRAIFRIAKYDKIISSSQKTADLLLSKGVARENIKIIPVGIDTDIYNPDLDVSEIKKKLKFQDYKNIILTVAGIIPHKGQEFLIRAIPDVLQRYPDTLFLIVGPIRSETYYNELIELIKDLNIEGNVRIFPEVTDAELYNYYQIADIYVQPSLEEGFCISILEAMSFGKPVIGTKTGAIPEFIQKSGAGILIDSESPEQICKAITTILLNPHKTRKMGTQARNYVVENYSWREVAEHTLDLYNNILKLNRKLTVKQNKAIIGDKK